MNTNQVRLIGAGLFFLFIFLFGFWLSRSDKPYSMILLNLHKLISLAAGVFLGLMVYQVHQATPLGALEGLAVAVTALFFVSTVISGGLVSIDKPMPTVIATIHKVFPYLTLLSTAAMLYLVLWRKG